MRKIRAILISTTLFFGFLLLAVLADAASNGEPFDFLQQQINEIVTGVVPVPVDWADVDSKPPGFADDIDDVDDADTDPLNEIQALQQRRVSVQDITVDGFTVSHVACGSGWIASGGGPGGLGDGVSLVASFPSNNTDEWIVSFDGAGVGAAAWAQCIRLE